MSRHFNEFKQSLFDYVIIDEFHHSAAKSYLNMESVAKADGMDSLGQSSVLLYADQVRGEGTLRSTDGFGANQEFLDEPTFSSFVADDVVFSGGTIDRVAVALEFSDPGSIGGFMQRASGWIIRTGTAAQMNAGTNASTTIGLSTTLMGVGNIGSNGSGGLIKDSRTFEITGLNIAVTGNMISVAPIMDFGVGGQTFILRNTAPLLGDGLNSIGYNPLGGFGGTTPVDTNAALSVNTVPEPATMIALGAGLAAFARRRRSSK